MDFRKGNFSAKPFLMQTMQVTLLGCLLVLLAMTFKQIKLADYFPIKSVQIYGASHLKRDEIKQLLLPLVQRGFFSVNVERIRNRLRQLTWVSDIFVRRNWPDQIEITVIEKNAVARWNKTNLLSQNGEVFTVDDTTSPSNLPDLIGPDGKQIVMLNYLNEINRLLTSLHVKISYLELSPFYNWKITLNNGITLQMGHTDVLTRLSRFVKVYPKIIGNRAEDVDYIDLRYANGMAVQWRSSYNA